MINIFPHFFLFRKVNHSKEIKPRLATFIYVHSDVTKDRLGKRHLVATTVECFHQADAVDRNNLEVRVTMRHREIMGKRGVLSIYCFCF